MNDGSSPDRVGIVAGGGVVDLGKPGVTISYTDGIALQGLALPVTMTWTANTVDSADPLAGQISSFSSWGLASDLALKPDVSAPGGNIRSTWPLVQDGGYNVISGTSMAAPHVTGAVADYLQAHPTATPRQVADAFQNTGVPFLGVLSTRADSTARQGAGLIHVDTAIASKVSVDPGKISLGDGMGGSSTLTFTNSGTSAVTYALANQSALTEDPFSGHYPFTFGTFFGNSSSQLVPVGLAEVRPERERVLPAERILRQRALVLRARTSQGSALEFVNVSVDEPPAPSPSEILLGSTDTGSRDGRVDVDQPGTLPRRRVRQRSS